MSRIWIAGTGGGGIPASYISLGFDEVTIQLAI